MTEESAFKSAAAAYSEGDYGLAFPLMRKLAEEGHPTACFLVALMYEEGEGAPVDRAACRYWLGKLESLAKAGNPLAQWELSCKYRWGNHFPRDLALANHWLVHAAENGNADAQFHLSSYLETGQYGFSLDPNEAQLWFDKALRQEHPEALYTKAVKLLQSDDPESREEALPLVRRSAASEFEPAKELLRQITH